MALVPRYTQEELVEFSHLLGLTGLALHEKPRDFLGSVFMQAEISNDRLGQFFTPYELSLVVARMSLQEVDPGKDLITVQEPACGSGGMVVAFCEAAREVGIDPAFQTYTVAVDVSEVAARMAYIQLAMLGIPAHVVWGDTIRMTQREAWPTMGFWNVAHKVARWRRGDVAVQTGKLSPLPPAPTPDDTVRIINPGRYVQADLFA
jgi:type I restriction-modification system DNA methylase subunit